MASARKLAQISARIFGEVVNPPTVRCGVLLQYVCIVCAHVALRFQCRLRGGLIFSSPVKYMRRPMIGPAVADWFPQENRNDERILHNLSLAGFYTTDELVRPVVVVSFYCYYYYFHYFRIRVFYRRR